MYVRVGNLTPDRYLKMYDIRMMRAMSPLQLIIDPTFLRFVPTYSSRLAVVSQVNVLDLLFPAHGLDLYLFPCRY